MGKGIETKEVILKSALELTSKFGLESLSIGGLAKSVGMSKSGLFSHFKSKEALQIMVMDYAAENFVLKVIKPAIREQRGIDRLSKMMDLWIEWSESYMAGGCPFLSAIVEYDDRPGNVRDKVQELQSTMISSFERAVKISQDEGQLDRSADSKFIAYEVYSNMIGYHIYSRLLKDGEAKSYFSKSFESIMDRYSPTKEEL